MREFLFGFKYARYHIKHALRYIWKRLMLTDTYDTSIFLLTPATTSH
jgi:hypothetical protein